jgi:hypothetical protein
MNDKMKKKEYIRFDRTPFKPLTKEEKEMEKIGVLLLIDSLKVKGKDNMKEKIEEILIRNNDWNADDEEVEISGVEFSRETMNDVIDELTDYITENYQPKTTSTDIEELRKEFMRKFTREIFEAVDVGEGQGDVVPVGLEIEPDALPEEIWNFFLPHLSNKSELKSAEHIKREAVRGLIEYLEVNTDKVFYLGCGKMINEYLGTVESEGKE